MSTERLGRNQIETFLKAFDEQLREGLRQAVRDQRVLLLTMHHIVSDGWSTRVLLRELLEAYESLAAADGADCDIRVAGRILNRIYLGDQTEFSVASEALGEVLVRASKTSAAVATGLAPGDAVVIGWRQQAGLALADT